MILKHLSRLACIATCSILALASTVWADNFNFIPIDVPGATHTEALGINDKGQIVGTFNQGPIVHAFSGRAFLLDNGNFTILPHGELVPRGPVMQLRTAADINNRGEIVGTMILSGGGLGGAPDNAYLREPNGTITRIAGSLGPSAPFAKGFGINDRGQAVVDSGARFPADRGFVRNQNGSTGQVVPHAQLFDINNLGQIVGNFNAALCAVSFANCALPGGAFLLNNRGEFTPIAVPGASSTEALGINDRGIIVGQFTDASGTHGFIQDKGIFTTVDVPGATSTTVQGINNAGLFVGSFTDANGRTRGYVDPPLEMPEPGTFFLLISGLTVLGMTVYGRHIRGFRGFGHQTICIIV